MSTYNCRGAINGIIVQNNPVNFIDPFGLLGSGTGSNNTPYYGSSDVDLGFLVPSHELLNNIAFSAAIVGGYAVVSGFGAPAAIVFGGIGGFAKSLDIALHSKNHYVDTAAAIVDQVLPVKAPYKLLTSPAIDYIANGVKDKIDEDSNAECQ